jgi:hypothetical protein
MSIKLFGKISCTNSLVNVFNNLGTANFFFAFRKRITNSFQQEKWVLLHNGGFCNSCITEKVLANSTAALLNKVTFYHNL